MTIRYMIEMVINTNEAPTVREVEKALVKSMAEEALGKELGACVLLLLRQERPTGVPGPVEIKPGADVPHPDGIGR